MPKNVIHLQPEPVSGTIHGEVGTNWLNWRDRWNENVLNSDYSGLSKEFNVPGHTPITAYNTVR